MVIFLEYNQQVCKQVSKWLLSYLEMRWQVWKISPVSITSKSAGRFIHITHIYTHTYILDTRGRGLNKAYWRCAGGDFYHYWRCAGKSCQNSWRTQESPTCFGPNRMKNFNRVPKIIGGPKKFKNQMQLSFWSRPIYEGKKQPQISRATVPLKGLLHKIFWVFFGLYG